MPDRRNLGVNVWLEVYHGDERCALSTAAVPPAAPTAPPIVDRVKLKPEQIDMDLDTLLGKWKAKEL